ncbi:type II toxin-antitoxin system HicA family toxin [Oscillatoria sp. HE19RPO]|uniref:type II toxin-antitoxin system HicA family toxin n=1 Tax=Oscillatoria sp. HE19RPO TaxID=2954806 RepID=UPI0020C3407C|nr:type II toxin-antitoxin system HicA family toxin [Oscillatoria sp. HE19RPO]
MPKKIIELKRLLRKAGFSSRSGKGSHTKWYHTRLPLPIILSGNNGDDAKPYQERDVNDALKIIEEEIE